MGKINVIFLDIDGVVATENAYQEAVCKWTDISDPELAQHRLDLREANGEYIPHFSLENWPFDATALKYLHKLQREETVRFVISSTWREGQTIDSLTKIFRLKGLNIQIHAFTPIGYSRGHEIKEWLSNKHEVVNYCVINDCDDEISKYHKNFVKTDFNVGITETDYNNICKVLDL